VHFLRNLAAVMFVVALPLLLVTSNVRFLANEVRFYERGFDKYDVEEDTGLERSELDRSAREIIDYFNNDAERLDIQVMQDGELVPLFSEKEVLHMVDVKDLFQWLFLTQEITLAFVAAYTVAVFVWAREASLRLLAKQVLVGLGVLLGVVLAVGVFAVIGFEDLWRQFHLLSFSNDLWELDPRTDRLIQMFPVDFWQESTFILAAITAAEMLLLAALSAGYLLRRGGGRTQLERPQTLLPERAGQQPG
jgi:integral membrane protein (TIGR01906 family)